MTINKTLKIFVIKLKTLEIFVTKIKIKDICNNFPHNCQTTKCKQAIKYNSNFMTCNKNKSPYAREIIYVGQIGIEICDMILTWVPRHKIDTSKTV